jgi:ribose/xylose/arabinose/galactoside ABC-type transport system permease subunit
VAQEAGVNAPGLGRRTAAFLLDHLPWLVALAIFAVGFEAVPAFRSPAYWRGLAEDYFVAAVLALALTPVILTGGIDLSVGSATVLSAVVAGVLIRDAGWPWPAAVAAAVATGLVAGLGNGLLVALGVVPLVATLATRELFRGIATAVSGGERVSGLPSAMEHAWRTRPGGLPLPLAVFGVLGFITYAAVHHTRFGRMVFAAGDNEDAARFAGVPVRRLKAALYTAAGLAAGLCGAAEVMHHRAAAVHVGQGLELTAIACVVLGGVRVTGGHGHVGGTLLGIVTVVVLLEGLAGAGPTGRDVALGALVVAVAAGNEAARRAAARRVLARPHSLGDPP